MDCALIAEQMPTDSGILSATKLPFSPNGGEIRHPRARQPWENVAQNRASPEGARFLGIQRRLAHPGISARWGFSTHIPHPVFNVSAAPILPSFPIHPGKRYVRRVTHADVGSCWVARPRIASSVILRLN